MADTSIPPMRRCKKCGVEYPATDQYFYKGGLGNKYLRYTCKICKGNSDKDLRKTPEHKQRRKTWDEKYAHSEKGKTFQKQRKSTPEYREYDKKRTKTTYQRAQSAKNQHARRARIAGGGGSHTVEDVALLYRSQKGKCWWCGKKMGDKYEVDHRIAIAKGGTDNPENLCLSCRHCNRTKSAKMPWEFNGRLL